MSRLTGKTAAEDTETESAVPGRKVLIAPVELRWNADISADVRSFISTLPSEPKPNPLAKPLRRLLMLAAALAREELLDEPNETALATLFQVLDGQMAEHRQAAETAVDDLLTADIRRLTASMVDQSTQDEQVQVAADARTVDDAFRAASRGLSAAVANGYVRRIASEDNPGAALDLVQARAEVAALMQIDDVLRAVEDRAELLTRQWLDRFRVEILALPEERQATYVDIRSQARTPEHRDTLMPDVIQEESQGADGELLKIRALHVLSDQSGQYPVGGLSPWELSVLDTELARPNVIAWYRNPSHATENAIRVPYRADDAWKSMQPDFIFVATDAEGTLVASIVDPHGHHLSDAVPKLQGLADFAERHGDRYQRIDSLGKDSADRTVLLDMKDEAVRAAVRSAPSASALFDGPHARAYM